MVRHPGKWPSFSAFPARGPAGGLAALATAPASNALERCTSDDNLRAELSTTGIELRIPSMSENCLYLNVYRPAGNDVDDGSLPVMVWIHGGVLVWGESNDYDPAQLVRHGVIVVTINYRLGALGFLAHAALADHPGGPWKLRPHGPTGGPALGADQYLQFWWESPKGDAVW